MKTTFNLLCIIFLVSVFTSCQSQDRCDVTSPNGKFRFELQLDNAQPFYRAYFNNKEIIGKSLLGNTLSGQENIPSQVIIQAIEKREVDATWEPVYGEKDRYPEQYRQAIVSFSPTVEDGPGFQLTIRAYNEGIAFRYEFEDTGETIIENELTEFALPADADVWVSDRAQSEITTTKISRLKKTPVERPLLAQLDDSLFVALGESALVDFARMKFRVSDKKPGVLVADLHSPVVCNGEFKSPWRTIMAGKTAGELLEYNYLLLNLNEPNKIANTDWIKPGKVIREVTLTTRGGLACVDFAVRHNLQYIEFDAGWYGNEYDEASDATTVSVDPKRSKGPLDLHKVIKYADSKGIGVILYVNRRALEKQLDDVLPLVKSWGVKGLKYGFVNVGSQEWTSWLHDAVRKAADHELMVDIHDEYRPTGYSRTYPNLMTQEGIRGDEESPDNRMVLKTLFVRMLAGAGDHTVCYFAERVGNKIGSHASQLAKSVCIYSPWQFLYWYDRPENSVNKVGGAGNNDKFILEVPELEFFDQLPTVWDDTKVIEGYPGEYAVVARRNGTTWFVGAINGNAERDFNVSHDFLDPDTNYEATIFTDDESVQTRTKVAMETRSVTSADVLKKRLGKDEGMALIIKKSDLK